METDAFLVLGAESSGTKFLTGLLKDGGCFGNDTDDQPFDFWESGEGASFGGKKPIVWRRSLPWDAKHLWPNIGLDLLKPLKKHGFQNVKAIVICRDWHSLWQSQTHPEHKHAPTEEAALENISLAYLEIFGQLNRLKLLPLVVTYEALVFFGERAVRPLLKKLGLNHNANLSPINNKLAKYYPEPV